MGRRKENKMDTIKLMNYLIKRIFNHQFFILFILFNALIFLSTSFFFYLIDLYFIAIRIIEGK